MLDSDPRNLDLDPNLIGDVVNDEVFRLQDTVFRQAGLLDELLGFDAPADDRDYRHAAHDHIALLEEIGLDANAKYSQQQIFALRAAIHAALES